MEIPFDNNSGEKYVLDVVPSDIDTGDGVVLTVNKKACEAFAQLFSQMALIFIWGTMSLSLKVLALGWCAMTTHNKTLNYTPAASGLSRTAKSVLRTGRRLTWRYVKK